MKPDEKLVKQFNVMLRDYIGSRSIPEICIEAGVHPKAVQNILNGRTKIPHEATIKVLCSALDRDPAPLIIIRNEAFYGDRTNAMVALVNKGTSLQAVGNLYGLSRERIRQIVGDKRGKFECRYCGTRTPIICNRTEFCSQKCRLRWDRETRHYIKFFSHINFTADENGCLNWKDGTSPAGYGRSSYSQNYYSHRMMWELTRGKIPKGKNVLHKCDNPRCCNPDHLYIGTQADNIKDRDADDRWGMKNGNGKEANDGNTGKD